MGHVQVGGTWWSPTTIVPDRSIGASAGVSHVAALMSYGTHVSSLCARDSSSSIDAEIILPLHPNKTGLPCWKTSSSPHLVANASARSLQIFRVRSIELASAENLSRKAVTAQALPLVGNRGIIAELARLSNM